MNSDYTIFNICPEGEFFGRVKELGLIMEAALESGRPAPGILFSGRRWTGKTELLRRAHRDLFWNQARVSPVYYQFKDGLSAVEFAEEFIKEVLKQHVSFRRRDPALSLRRNSARRFRQRHSLLSRLSGRGRPSKGFCLTRARPP
ncbi:MAG: hypothetical protein HZB83_08805 [Deltaproteobacteria bacterium]|nr:hypothetical protein [Deltaproteobacteria bacterium]